MQIKNYKLVLRLLKSEQISFRSIFIFSVVGNMLLLTIPFFISQLTEQFSILVFQQATLFLIILAILFLFGVAAMRLLQMNLSERLQRRIFLDGTNRLRKKIFKYKQEGTQLSLQKVNYFFEYVNLQKSLIPLFIDGATLAIQAIVVFLLISLYHPLFMFYSILIIGSLYFVLVVLGRETETLSLAESQKKYAVISYLQKIAQSKEDDIKMESAELDEHLLNYFSVRDSRYSMYFKQSALILLIKVIASAVLLSLGGILVVNNKMTIGQLIASELIVTNLLISLFKFTHLLDYWYDTIVAVHKIDTQLSLGEEHL